MLIQKRSHISGKLNVMDIPVTMDRLDAYLEGKGLLIQDVFPDLTPDQREFLLTGATPQEWDELFAEEE